MLHTKNLIIKNKAGLVNLAEELGNVTKVYKGIGVSPDTFYRHQDLAEKGGLDKFIVICRIPADFSALCLR